MPVVIKRKCENCEGKCFEGSFCPGTAKGCDGGCVKWSICSPNTVYYDLECNPADATDLLAGDVSWSDSEARITYSAAGGKGQLIINEGLQAVTEFEGKLTLGNESLAKLGAGVVEVGIWLSIGDELYNTHNFCADLKDPRNLANPLITVNGCVGETTKKTVDIEFSQLHGKDIVVATLDDGAGNVVDLLPNINVENGVGLVSAEIEYPSLSYSKEYCPKIYVELDKHPDDPCDPLLCEELVGENDGWCICVPGLDPLTGESGAC